MATHELALEEIKQAVANDPNSKLAKQVQTVLERLDQSKFARIPSINEFSDLLHEVTTDLENGSKFFDENDIVLLKISNKLTIYFGKDENESKSNNTTKIEFPKLAILSDSNDVDQATNTLHMTKYDIFNCLLIGCKKIFDGISNQMIEKQRQQQLQQVIKSDNINSDDKAEKQKEQEEKEKAKVKEKKETPNEETNILNHIFSNISKYYVDSSDKTRNKELKESISGIWSLLTSCMSFNNVYDKQCWIYRLAMILMIVHDNDNDGDNQKNGQFKKLSFVDEKDEGLNCLFLSRHKDGLSLLQDLLVQIGCFIDVYNLIVDKSSTNVVILAKFVAYYCYFEKLLTDKNQDDEMYDDEDEDESNVGGEKDKEGVKEHFLLSMREVSRNMTLLGAARERGDKILEKTLSKYIVKNEMLNEKLNKYSDYMNEMFSILRKEFTTV